MVNKMAGKAWRTAASHTALTNSCPPCYRLRKYHVCHGFGIHPFDLDKQIIGNFYNALPDLFGQCGQKNNNKSIIKGLLTREIIPDFF